MSAPAIESLTDKASLDLLARGYVPIEEFKGIKTGARVRNVSHQYSAAYIHGTATVVAVMEKVRSGWSFSYGVRDIEIVVDLDDKTWGSRRAWTNYGTVLAKPLGL